VLLSGVNPRWRCNVKKAKVTRFYLASPGQ
jgi:hypothetical protein